MTHAGVPGAPEPVAGACSGLDGPTYKIREKGEEKSFNDTGKLVHYVLELGKKGLRSSGTKVWAR